MLTGKQLVQQGIITGEINEENIQQHGVDCNVIKVERMKGEGFIPTKGKTKLVEYEKVKADMVSINEGNDIAGTFAWRLSPGAYSVTFSQGCKIPADKMLLIRQRSSLLRNGAFLHSSVFDAGYSCVEIGTVIVVTHPIIIEVGARIAQIYAHDSNVVENLYDGQFQGK